MTTQEFLAQEEEHREEEYEYTRESIEDLFQSQYDYQTSPEVRTYQPVLYEIVKDPSELQEKESLHQTHDKFLERTEQILKIHHQRSHIHDGLKHLSDNELIAKVREAPKKLKRNAKAFLKKLQKYGVSLDEMGEVDLSGVKDDNVKKYIEKNIGLVRLTLMQADLEFEYP